VEFTETARAKRTSSHPSYCLQENKTALVEHRGFGGLSAQGQATVELQLAVRNRHTRAASGLQVIALFRGSLCEAAPCQKRPCH